MSETFKPKIVGIKQVLEDLKSGVTRWKKDDLGFGSIEEKYNLTFTEMKLLLADKRIKGIKTYIPTMIIVDDADDVSSYEKFTNPKTLNDDEDEEESIPVERAAPVAKGNVAQEIPFDEPMPEKEPVAEPDNTKVTLPVAETKVEIEEVEVVEEEEEDFEPSF